MNARPVPMRSRLSKNHYTAHHRSRDIPDLIVVTAANAPLRECALVQGDGNAPCPQALLIGKRKARPRTRMATIAPQSLSCPLYDFSCLVC
eukprot:3578369-Pyramimonas_sp.AAC.1